MWPNTHRAWRSSYSKRRRSERRSTSRSPAILDSDCNLRVSITGIGNTWKFFRHEVKTSIIQGIAVFLSLFEADPDVRRVFCPPKELYEGKPVESDPEGRVLPPFDELIETGKVIGLDFPVALNPCAGQNHWHDDEDRLPARRPAPHTEDGSRARSALSVHGLYL
jgi:hypothetical protein